MARTEMDKVRARLIHLVRLQQALQGSASVVGAVGIYPHGCPDARIQEHRYFERRNEPSYGMVTLFAFSRHNLNVEPAQKVGIFVRYFDRQSGKVLQHSGNRPVIVFVSLYSDCLSVVRIYREEMLVMLHCSNN